MTDSISQAENFLNDYKRFSKTEIKNEHAVFNLIETIFRLENIQLLEDISFSAKYCSGLLKILGQTEADVSEDYKKEMEKNFAEAVDQIKSKLNEIISGFNEFERESFKRRYFEMSQVGFNRLLSLINDFSEIKLFLNERKRTQNQF